MPSASDVTTFDQLLQQGRVRQLASDEVLALCTAAYRADRDAVVELLKLRTAAARGNVLAAKRIAAHIPRLYVAPERFREALPRASGMPFELSGHLVERFRVRSGRMGEPIAELLACLTEEATMSSPIRERSPAGDQQWRSPVGYTFIIRRDRDGSRPVCVTVLAPVTGPTRPKLRK
jgi:hypothetical protein